MRHADAVECMCVSCARNVKYMNSLCRLGKVETGDIGESKFVKPLGIFYELDGKHRKWVSSSHEPHS